MYEVGKLLAVDFIHEIDYLKWLVNIILIKKVNDKW